MPVIEKILKVSTFATPSIWDIETDRGPTRIRLKGEEDICRIAGNTLLIADSNGLQFLINTARSYWTVSARIHPATNSPSRFSSVGRAVHS